MKIKELETRIKKEQQRKLILQHTHCIAVEEEYTVRLTIFLKA